MALPGNSDQVDEVSPPRETFTYAAEALVDDEIRVLELKPGPRDTEIVCRLSTVRLSHASTKYEAMSYMWGNQRLQRVISLNGREKKIGLNLWDGLKALRLEHQKRILWVDALCIDQENKLERNHQVQQMDWIYQCAKSVLIWLGPVNDERKPFYVLPFFSQENVMSLDCLSISQADLVSWLVEFCRLPYWTRVWIVQEVSLACNIYLYWGEDSAEWDPHYDMFHYDAAESLDIPHRDKFLSLIRGSVPAQLSFEYKMNTSSDPIRKPWFDHISKQKPLFDLVLMYQRCECADIRDKIFGLRGLAMYCCRENIPVDYDQPPCILALDTLKHHFFSPDPPGSWSDDDLAMDDILVSGQMLQTNGVKTLHKRGLHSEMVDIKLFIQMLEVQDSLWLDNAVSDDYEDRFNESQQIRMVAVHQNRDQELSVSWLLIEGQEFPGTEIKSNISQNQEQSDLTLTKILEFLRRQEYCAGTAEKIEYESTLYLGCLAGATIIVRNRDVLSPPTDSGWRSKSQSKSVEFLVWVERT